MATKKKPKEQHDPRGQPTAYKPEYCAQLIEHMSGGNSFESFGAKIDVARSTIYLWLDLFPEFSDAKARGLDKNLLYWEEVGKAGTTGALRRVSEEHTSEVDGVKKTIKKYAPAAFAQAAWSITMKNMHNWREKKEITGPGGKSLFEGLSDEEVDRKIEEQIKILGYDPRKK